MSFNIEGELWGQYYKTWVFVSVRQTNVSGTQRGERAEVSVRQHPTIWLFSLVKLGMFQVSVGHTNIVS